MRKLGDKVRIPADGIEGVIDRMSPKATGRVLYRLASPQGGRWYDAEEVRSA